MFGRKKNNNEEPQKFTLDDLMKQHRPTPRMQETLQLAAAFELFERAENDPEDVLFLQLTQKEIMLLGMAMMTFGFAASRYPFFGDANNSLNNLRVKIADAMVEQKGQENNED